MKQDIERFIAEAINPFLANHGGSIQVANYHDGLLALEFMGGCAGCPHSKLTMYNFVVPHLMENFPDLKDVELV